MNLSILFTSSLLLGGCATQTLGLDRELAGPRAGVALELRPHADSTHAFPAVLEAQLPSADRLARQILTELGELATVEVALCVAPSGQVASIDVTRTSALPAFDRAVVADARAWRFAAMPGPVTVRTCQRTTVAYRPPA